MGGPDVCQLRANMSTMVNSKMEVGLEALQRVLRLGGPSLLDRLIATGMANLEERFRELHQAAHAADGETGQRAAHSIKGSCLYLGLDALAGAAAAIEEAAGARRDGWTASALALDAAQIEEARAALAAARAVLLP